MIAYNPQWLRNLPVREESDAALSHHCISSEEWKDIEAAHPAPFYTPNFFIRVGLFLLTVVICLFSFGILSLIFMQAISEAVGALAIFFAVAAYAALEYMVRAKHHFRSGVDDALLWIAALCFWGGLAYSIDANALLNSVLILIISLFAVLRFGDGTMAAVLILSVVGVVFFTLLNLGEIGKAVTPFVVMVTALIAYFITKKAGRQIQLVFYQHCLQTISVLALVILYLAGNYLVVRELSISLFGLRLTEYESIPMGWLFWTFTVLLPCIYLLAGIFKRDLSLLRISLLLIGATVFTIRAYYHVLPTELAMTIGGVVLILVSYLLMRYLKVSRGGFTSVIKTEANAAQAIIESLVIAEVLQGQTGQQNNQFGGGDFGGGGATGDF